MKAFRDRTGFRRREHGGRASARCAARGLVAAALLCAVPCGAQELTAEQAVALGLANGPEMAALQRKDRQARDDVSAAGWRFAPDISYRPSWVYRYDWDGNWEGFLAHDVMLADLLPRYQTVFGYRIAKAQQNAQQYDNAVSRSEYVARLLSQFYEAVFAVRREENADRYYESCRRAHDLYPATDGDDPQANNLKLKIVKCRLEWAKARQKSEEARAALADSIGMELAELPVLARQEEYTYRGPAPTAYVPPEDLAVGDPFVRHLDLSQEMLHAVKIGTYFDYIPYPTVRLGESRDIGTGRDFFYCQTGIVIPIFQGLEGLWKRRSVSYQEEALASARSRYLRTKGRSLEALPRRIAEIGETLEAVKGLADQYDGKAAAAIRDLPLGRIPIDGFFQIVEKWYESASVLLDLREQLVRLEVAWDQATGSLDTADAGRPAE
jgi:hypothetical protein